MHAANRRAGGLFKTRQIWSTYSWDSSCILKRVAAGYSTFGSVGLSGPLELVKCPSAIPIM